MKKKRYERKWFAVAPRAWVNAALLVFTVVIILLLAEGGLRILELIAYKQPDFEKYKNIYKSELSKNYLFGHESNIDITLTKGYYKFRFITNACGLREVKDYNHLEKSIIFIGDSVIEGASVENNETLDSIFEKMTGIVSLNFGVGSSNTVQEFYFLQHKYRKSYNTKLAAIIHDRRRV